MKFDVTVEIIKGDGARQDVESIREALDEAISGIDSIWVQDEDHDDETPYEIKTVTVHELGAG